MSGQITRDDRKGVIAVEATPIGAGVPAATSSGAARDIVTLILPAASAYLSVLRTATASLAARADFTLDDIEDLRIAVDEACALLLVGAVPGSDLRCTFSLTPGLISVSVTVSSLDGEPPSTESFAWTVLTALAGEVSSSVDGASQVTINLQKRRADQLESRPAGTGEPAVPAAPGDAGGDTSGSAVATASGSVGTS
jgi:serine/threonine-protein kinase RsbW